MIVITLIEINFRVFGVLFLEQINIDEEYQIGGSFSCCKHLTARHGRDGHVVVVVPLSLVFDVTCVMSAVHIFTDVRNYADGLVYFIGVEAFDRSTLYVKIIFFFLEIDSKDIRKKLNYP